MGKYNRNTGFMLTKKMVEDLPHHHKMIIPRKNGFGDKQKIRVVELKEKSDLSSRVSNNYHK